MINIGDKVIITATISSKSNAKNFYDITILGTVIEASNDPGYGWYCDYEYLGIAGSAFWLSEWITAVKDLSNLEQAIHGVA